MIIEYIEYPSGAVRTQELKEFNKELSAMPRDTYKPALATMINNQLIVKEV